MFHVTSIGSFQILGSPTSTFQRSLGRVRWIPRSRIRACAEPNHIHPNVGSYFQDYGKEGGYLNHAVPLPYVARRSFGPTVSARSAVIFNGRDLMFATRRARCVIIGPFMFSGAGAHHAFSLLTLILLTTSAFL